MKVSNSGPTQKTLQSFLKGIPCPAVTSVMKQTKYSPAGKSALARFKYGSSSSDTKAEEDSNSDINMAMSHNSVLELSASEPDTYRTDVEDEIFGDTTSHNHPEGPELQTEQRPFDEDLNLIPDTKRARTEKQHFIIKPEPKDCSNNLDKTSLGVDSPVCLQRRKVPLQFSLQELAAKMKRLKDQQAHRAKEELCYRRFKAKINPGENQSAEAELKKEIR